MDRSRFTRKDGSFKKMGKYFSMLKAQHNITPCEEPQKSIVLCNGGLASGISKEDIVHFFSKFGILENIVLIKKKSHGFITFKDVKCAKTCYEMYHGKSYFPQLNGPMYFLYVNKVPNIEPCLTILPPESTLHKDFVTPEEESALLECVNFNGDDWNSLKQRKVKHFGYEFVYGENSAKKNEKTQDIPPLCDYFWDRIKNLGFALEWIPDQLTVNCYKPGQGIPPHIDVHSIFEDTIFIISLGSDIQMEFKNQNDHYFVPVPRRSILILSGESRYAWTHGISSRDKDVYKDKELGYIVAQRGTRVSFTFRRVRHKKCICKFPLFCDSRVTDSSALEDANAVEIENKYVTETYRSIANHFSQTRHKPWPNVLEFVQNFPRNSILLDVGCGNGKYFGFNNNIFEIGSELCSSLTQICKERGFETVNNSCLCLPFIDNIFDGVICIAVLHHLSTFTRRQLAMKELIRVLKPGGKGLVYVWSEQQTEEISLVEQEEYDYQSEGPLFGNNIVLNSTVTLPIVANNGKNFIKKDILVPWKTKVDNQFKTFLRYYHIFEEKELEELCKTSGGSVIKTYYDTGNWCLVYTKLND